MASILQLSALQQHSASRASNARTVCTTWMLHAAHTTAFLRHPHRLNTFASVCPSPHPNHRKFVFDTTEIWHSCIATRTALDQKGNGMAARGTQMQPPKCCWDSTNVCCLNGFPSWEVSAADPFVNNDLLICLAVEHRIYKVDQNCSRVASRS